MKSKFIASCVLALIVLLFTSCDLYYLVIKQYYRLVVKNESQTAITIQAYEKGRPIDEILIKTGDSCIRLKEDWVYRKSDCFITDPGLVDSIVTSNESGQGILLYCNGKLLTISTLDCPEIGNSIIHMNTQTYTDIQKTVQGKYIRAQYTFTYTDDDFSGLLTK